MKALVIGAGEVGFDVARTLAMEQHDVIVIDTSSDALDNVHEKLDVMTVQGTGTSGEVLYESGIESADMVIAVTSIDEVNIIACMMADRLGVNTTIARVRSDELTRTQSVLKAGDLGIDLVIHPEESAAAEVVRLLRRAGATDVLPFAEGRLQLVGIRIDKESPVGGMQLRDLLSDHPTATFRIMGIARGNRTILPRGDETLQPNDQLFVLARPDELAHVTQILGKSQTSMREVMILGGTSLGAKIALQVSSEEGKYIKIIEPDREAAQKLAEELEDVLVIHGDPTDIDLLAAEGLGEMDAFVAVTQDEESNLVTSLMAKHLGVRKTISLLSKGAYIPISQTIGLDAAVSKKLAVSREIMRFLRGKHVQSVATVYGLDAEILEIEAKREAPVTQGPLRDLSLPSGLLIGAVHYNGRVEVATGDTHIQAGSRAIIFVLPTSVSEAERYFDTR